MCISMAAIILTLYIHSVCYATTYIYPRLYLEFTTKAIIASAFGQTAETTGVSSDIISTANTFITAFLDSMSNGAKEITVILCKLTIEESITSSYKVYTAI